MTQTQIQTHPAEAGDVIDHEFKSHPDVFWPAARGEKSFEFRRDDRGGYHVGQTVRIRCYLPLTKSYVDTPPLDRRITNILRGGEFELPAGYCILSLAPASPASRAPAAVPGSAHTMRQALELAEGRLALLMDASLPESDHPCATGHVLKWVRDTLAAAAPAAPPADGGTEGLPPAPTADIGMKELRDTLKELTEAADEMIAFVPGHWHDDHTIRLTDAAEDANKVLKAAEQDDLYETSPRTPAGAAGDLVRVKPDEMTRDDARRRALALVASKGWKPGDNFSLHSVAELMTTFALSLAGGPPLDRCAYPDCGCDRDGVCATDVLDKGDTRPASPAPAASAGGEGAIDWEHLNALFAKMPPGPWDALRPGDGFEIRQIDTDPTNKHHWPFRLCQSILGQRAQCDAAVFDFIASVLNVWPQIAALAPAAQVNPGREEIARYWWDRVCPEAWKGRWDEAKRHMGFTDLVAETYDDADAILAARPVAEGDAGWQPIKTAPKDGTHLLCLTTLASGPEYNIGRFCNDDWHDRTGWYSDEGSDITPTHWRPLPEPPAARPAPSPAKGGN